MPAGRPEVLAAAFCLLPAAVGARPVMLVVAFCLLPAALGVKRLTIVNGCATDPIWIAHLANTGVGPGEQNAKVDPGSSFTFDSAETDGLGGARYWPKMGCDDNGDHCSLGGSGGPTQACVINGDDYSNCAPPVDTKFEATWGREGEPCDASDPAAMAGCDSVDVSLVDGWTLPFKFEVNSGVCTAAGEKTVKEIDCSGLTLDHCPLDEDLGHGPVSMQAISPHTGQQAGCYGPCLKLVDDKWGNTFATGRSREDPDVVPYCCTTPPMDSESCNAGPIKSSKYLEAVHTLCPGVYGFAYDDGMGLLRCTYGEYTVTFYCPSPGAPGAAGAGAGVPINEQAAPLLDDMAPAPVDAAIQRFEPRWPVAQDLGPGALPAGAAAPATALVGSCVCLVAAALAAAVVALAAFRARSLGLRRRDAVLLEIDRGAYVLAAQDLSVSPL